MLASVMQHLAEQHRRLPQRRARHPANSTPSGPGRLPDRGAGPQALLRRGVLDPDLLHLGDGPQLAVTIPWGDVSTAWYTTGIPDISVYAATTPRQVRLLRLADRFGAVLRLGAVQRLMKRRIAAGAPGPSERTLVRTTSDVWGEARAADGRTAAARLRAPAARRRSC
jgi:short subunit dehydrogenase-like uncharacterized protein